MELRQIASDPRVVSISKSPLSALQDAESSSFDVIVHDLVGWRGGSRPRPMSDECNGPMGTYGCHLGQEAVMLAEAHRVLSSPGVLMLPAMVAPALDNGTDLASVLDAVQNTFAWSAPLLVEAPWREGGEAGMVVASKDGSDCRKTRRAYTGEYYNADIHEASFVLPPWLVSRLSRDGECRAQNSIAKEAVEKVHSENALSCWKMLFQHETSFQEITLWQHSCWGQLLALNNVEQTSQGYGFVAYDEMISHTSLLGSECCSGPSMRAGGAAVLIVGGGDGGTLREVLKWPSATETCGMSASECVQVCEQVCVSRVVMIELDSDVINASRRLGIHGNYEDPRVEVIIGDGRAYVEKLDPGSFDLIIVDSGDAGDLGHEKIVGEAEGVLSDVFFNDGFYNAMSRALSGKGAAVMHTDAPALSEVPLRRVVTGLLESSAFLGAYAFRVPVPISDGGFMSMVLAVRHDSAVNRSRHNASFIHYSPETHAAAFALPSSWRRALPKGHPQASY
eukprot:TRINITY_DN15433_c0_g4_i1.p1 TRINITY_DN15433_c0_g4~~TRINITY_DN15433_c0_g4_i1.p1  ORF type:complete len:575 (+),score=88.71 TRINITY_DN15433_c0_g4_i1:207-1727(+)